MAIIQLNSCIRNDLAVDYYTMVKFCEKNCKDLNASLNHLEINAAYSIYNLYTLYSVTPCISYTDSKTETNRTYTSTLLILINNKTKDIINCSEMKQSIIDVDKYFQDILEKYFRITCDTDHFFKRFIERDIKEKDKSSEIINNSKFSSTIIDTEEKKNEELRLFETPAKSLDILETIYKSSRPDIDQITSYTKEHKDGCDCLCNKPVDKRHSHRIHPIKEEEMFKI